MNLFWLYDLPNWLFACLVIGFFVSVAIIGQRYMRRWVLRLSGYDGKYNEMVETTLATVGVFFGITLGLISVATWQNFSQVSDNVNREATCIAVMYRHVSLYPEPAATALKKDLESYVDYLVREAWPLQRQGIVPEKGAMLLTTFQKKLWTFEPTTEGSKILHQQSIKTFGDIAASRRQRIQSVTAGLPATLWLVVIFGALTTISISWFMVYDRQVVQDLMLGTISLTIGLLIYLMAAMDHPFRGELSINASAFELLLGWMRNLS